MQSQIKAYRMGGTTFYGRVTVDEILSAEKNATGKVTDLGRVWNGIRESVDSKLAPYREIVGGLTEGKELLPSAIADLLNLGTVWTGEMSKMNEAVVSGGTGTPADTEHAREFYMGAQESDRAIKRRNHRDIASAIATMQKLCSRDENVEEAVTASTEGLVQGGVGMGSPEAAQTNDGVSLARRFIAPKSGVDRKSVV